MPMGRSGSAGAQHEGTSMFRSGSAAVLSREARDTSAASLLRPENAGMRRDKVQSSIAASKATISSVCSLRASRNERGHPASKAAQEGFKSSQSRTARHSTRRSRGLYDTSWQSPATGGFVSTSGLTSAGSLSRGIAARAVADSGGRGRQARCFEAPDLIVGVGLDIVKRVEGPPAASSCGTVGGESNNPHARARSAATCADEAAGAVCAAAGATDGTAAAAPEGGIAPCATATCSGRAEGRQTSESSRSSEDLWELADRLGMLSGFLSGNLVWDGGALHRAVVQGRLPALPPAHTWALSPSASQADHKVAVQPPGLALPSSVTRVPSTRRQPSPAPLSAEALQVRGNACWSAAAARPPPSQQAAKLQEVPLPILQEQPLQIVPLSDWLSDVTVGLLRRTSQALLSSLPSDDELKMFLEPNIVDPVLLSIRGRSLSRESHEKAVRPRLGKNTWKQQLEFGGDFPSLFPADIGSREDLLIWRIRLAKRQARRRHPELGRPKSLPPPMQEPDRQMQFMGRKVPDEMDCLGETSSTGSTTTPHSTSVSSAGFSGSGLGGARQASQASTVNCGPAVQQRHLAPPTRSAASALTPRTTDTRAGPAVTASKGPAMDRALTSTSHSNLDREHPLFVPRRASRQIRTMPITAVEKAVAEALSDDDDDDAESLTPPPQPEAEAEAPPRLRPRRLSVTSSSDAMAVLSQNNLLHPNLRFAGIEDEEEEAEVQADAGKANAAMLAKLRERRLYEEQFAAKALKRKIGKRHTVHAGFYHAPDESEEDAPDADAETLLQEELVTADIKPVAWKVGEPLFRVKSGNYKVLDLSTTSVRDADLDSAADADGPLARSLLPPAPHVDKDTWSTITGMEFSRQTSRQTVIADSEVSTVRFERPAAAAAVNEPQTCGRVLGCLAQEFRQCLEEAGFFKPEKCMVKENYNETCKRGAAVKEELRLRKESQKELTAANKPALQEAEADTHLQVCQITGHWQRRSSQDGDTAGFHEKEEAAYQAHLDMRKEKYGNRLQAWSSKIVSKSKDRGLWSRKTEICRFSLRGLTALSEYANFMGRQRASSTPAKAMSPASATVAV